MILNKNTKIVIICGLLVVIILCGILAVFWNKKLNTKEANKLIQNKSIDIKIETHNSTNNNKTGMKTIAMNSNNIGNIGEIASNKFLNQQQQVEYMYSCIHCIKSVILL